MPPCRLAVRPQRCWPSLPTIDSISCTALLPRTRCRGPCVPCAACRTHHDEAQGCTRLRRCSSRLCRRFTSPGCLSAAGFHALFTCMCADDGRHAGHPGGCCVHQRQADAREPHRQGGCGVSLTPQCDCARVPGCRPRRSTPADWTRLTRQTTPRWRCWKLVGWGVVHRRKGRGGDSATRSQSRQQRCKHDDPLPPPPPPPLSDLVLAGIRFRPRLCLPQPKGRFRVHKKMDTNVAVWRMVPGESVRVEVLHSVLG